MKKILVLDTNVLLTEPQSLYRFPNCLVIIPQTVLKELDKIKMSRADKTLQYNGRLVSRYLFSIAAAGSLAEGVELENGSVVKVADLTDKENLPQSLKTKFSDDQILALAYQMQQQNKDSEVYIITNDLNMLIKAQSYKLKTEHHTGMPASSKFKRFFSNQVATIKKNPVMALFLMLIFGGMVAIIILLSSFVPAPQGPPEFIAQNQLYQAKEKQYINLLDKDPGDRKALFGLTELYVQMGHYYKDSDYYSRALDRLEQSYENNVRNYQIEATMSRLHFLLGMDDIANSELEKIVKSKSNDAFTALAEQANKAYEAKDFEIAVTFFNKALDIKPKEINTIVDLANTYYENNQPDETIAQLHRALEINSKHAIIYYNLGIVYWQKKSDGSTALSYFEKFLELQPTGELADQVKENITQIKRQTKG